jgi:hypothetical protein
MHSYTQMSHVSACACSDPACMLLQLMLHSEIQLVSHFDNADYISFRAVVLQNILATDMARHGEYTAKLKRRVDPNTPAEEKGTAQPAQLQSKSARTHLAYKLLSRLSGNMHLCYARAYVPLSTYCRVEV